MADYITAPSNGVSTVNVPIGNNNASDYLTFMQNNTAAANAFNAQQSQKQMDFQVAQNAKAMDFNHREAELNRNWQKMMSDTAHQREIQDLINAGLNPVLSALGGSGASVGAGSAAQAMTSSGSKADADTSVNAAMAGLLSTLISGQTQRDVANINAAASMHNAELSSDATRYAAGLNYSGLMAQLAQPSTLFGLISRFWNESGFSQNLNDLFKSWTPDALAEAFKGAFTWDNPFDFESNSGSTNSGSTGSGSNKFSEIHHNIYNIFKQLKSKLDNNTTNPDKSFSRYYKSP